MFLAIFFFSVIVRVLSHDNDGPIFELEKGQLKQISLVDINSKIIYIVSQNKISGTFTYDIKSPYLLELSYGKSDNNNKIPDSFEGHYEKIDEIKCYFYSISISVNINQDNKYFIKIFINDDINKLNDNNIINIHLIGNYAWKITCFVIAIFFFEIFFIIYFCCCQRKCLIECCNFRKKKEMKSYKKLEEIYELNTIDIGDN